MNRNISREYPRLVFSSVSSDELDEVLALVEMKQYCSVAELETSAGVIYPVSFITPLRASQMLDHSDCYAEPCLIIVKDTTFLTMETSARKAWEEGIFKNMIPNEEPSESN